MLQSVVQPVVLSLEPDEDSGLPSMSRNEDLFRLGQTAAHDGEGSTVELRAPARISASAGALTFTSRRRVPKRVRFTLRRRVRFRVPKAFRSGASPRAEKGPDARQRSRW